MVNEVISPIAGLTELMIGSGMAVAKTDEVMAETSLKVMAETLKLLATLKAELPDITTDQAMALVEHMVPQTYRVGVTEIMIRGNINQRHSFSVEGGVTAGFLPFVSGSISAAYGEQNAQEFGAEIRTTLAVTPQDTKMVSDIFNRASGRIAPDPKTIEHLDYLLPLLKEVFDAKD